MTRLVPDTLRRRWSDRTIASKRFSCSTFMLYLGIEGRYDDVPHHTIYLSEDYRENLADIEQRHVLTKDPSMYVQNACVTDPSLAPEGMSTLYLLVPVTHRHPNVDWRREAPAFRKKTLDQLEKIGLPGVRDRILYEKMVTPDDWQDDYEIYRGATFNLSHDLGQMLHMRPHNRFEDLDGCYLVGGGTHPGSGLPVIYSSARITTQLLLEDLGLPASGQATRVEDAAMSLLAGEGGGEPMAGSVGVADRRASDESTTPVSAAAAVETVSVATRNQPQ